MDTATDDILIHYGVKRRSGRYPWGSGEDPYQHSGDFLARIDELKKQGLGDTDIARSMGLTTTEFRVQKRLANHERRQLEVARAKSLRDDGLNPSEIARAMGYKNESSIRSLLNERTEARKNAAQATAETLRKEIAEKGMIDVGAGVERELGVSENVLKEAIYILEREGYNKYGVGIPQVNNPGKQTNTPVLTAENVEYRHVYENMGDIKSVGDYHSTDGGKSWDKREYPASIDSGRVAIRYGDDGGSARDGVIEIRRGVEDLSLGNSHYAQVRIMVDGTHYLKGMAIYSDDIPEGKDIVFNTNKPTGTPMNKVLKGVKRDKDGEIIKDSPFGAVIKANGQSYYIGSDGKKHLSAINKLKEEGDWDAMSDNLSQQFLSKQPVPFIKKQLAATYDDFESEYNEIMSMTNPTVRRKLLYDFAGECDSATVDLKARPLPRQKTQVILPLDKMKDNEIFAPNYENGERVVLIRYPHGGTFEIPELTVNNRSQYARKVLGADIRDAVGINSRVAERLSGADFDGDQVVVIPVNDRVKVKTTAALDALKGFDPKLEYPERPGMTYMTKEYKQKQMGIVSNLITDMTIRGAKPDEIARAVKHSMVVIDAEKHKLDYKKSEVDNGIAELKQKYQTHVDLNGDLKVGGASTLLSRRKQTVEVPERRGAPKIDPKTGKVYYSETGRKFIDKDTGKERLATTKSSIMLEVDDAHRLSSGSSQEDAYADYANKLKDLANKARLDYLHGDKLKRDPAAAAAYANEVSSLDHKLGVAKMNAPRERRAQVIANSVVKAQIQANPNMDKKEIKKAGEIALNDARLSVSASGKSSRVTITDREWSAIQAGAISDSKLNEILKYADPDRVRSLALPKTATTVTPAKARKIASMKKSGYTNAEIAESVGVSVSTVNEYADA